MDDEFDEMSVDEGDTSSQGESDVDGDSMLTRYEAIAEVKRLRKALEDQKAQTEELRHTHREDITNATDALVREQYLLNSINALRPRHKPIHDIALRLVFEAIFPPEGFLDPMLGLGPDSPWSRALRTRKALTLVCHQWYEVAYPLLYSDIVIRRLGQIAALTRTLQSNPKYYTEIRSLTLLCHVSANMNHFAKTHLSILFNSSTSLQSLALGPMSSTTLDCTPCAEPRTLSETTGFRAALGRVQRLEYNWMFETGHLAQFVANIGSYSILTHLTIVVPAPSYMSLHIRLQALKILTLATGEGISGRSDLQPFCTWDLPALEQVRFRPFICDPRVPSSFVDFLRKQTLLRMLDLGCRPVSSSGPADPVSLYARLQEALAVCPSIRRLVVPAAVGNNLHVLDSTLAEVDLDHVDVWTALLDTRMSRAVSGLRWRSVRLLDSGLSTVLDLPHLLLPWSVEPRSEWPERSTYVHDIFGMRIVETERSIVRQDLPWEHVKGDCNIYGIGPDNFRFGDEMDVDMDEYDSSDPDVGSLESTSDYDDAWSTEEVSDDEVQYILRGRLQDRPPQSTSTEALDIFTTLADN